MPYQYTPSNIQRFNIKIKVAPSGCHEWQGARNRQGYGVFGIGRKMLLAHRAAWEITNGPIPDGLMCLHVCDNPCCCNLEHLWLGTQTDNMRDCAAKGRENRTIRARGEAHGLSKLTGENVAEIRRMYSSGNYSQRKLASIFRVSQPTIGSVIRRETWI